MPETEELKQKEEQKEVEYELKEEEGEERQEGGEGMVDEWKDEEQNPGIDLTVDDQPLSKGG